MLSPIFRLIPYLLPSPATRGSAGKKACRGHQSFRLGDQHSFARKQKLLSTRTRSSGVSAARSSASSLDSHATQEVAAPTSAVAPTAAPAAPTPSPAPAPAPVVPTPLTPAQSAQAERARHVFLLSELGRLQMMQFKERAFHPVPLAMSSFALKPQSSRRSKPSPFFHKPSSLPRKWSIAARSAVRQLQTVARSSAALPDGPTSPWASHQRQWTGIKAMLRRPYSSGLSEISFPWPVYGFHVSPENIFMFILGVKTRYEMARIPIHLYRRLVGERNNWLMLCNSRRFTDPTVLSHFALVIDAIEFAMSLYQPC